MSPLPSTYGETHGLALMEGLEDAGKLVFSTADAKAIGKRRGMTPAPCSSLPLDSPEPGGFRRIKRGLYTTRTGKLPGSMAPHDFHRGARARLAVSPGSPHGLALPWALRPDTADDHLHHDVKGGHPVDAWEQSREQRLGD